MSEKISQLPPGVTLTGAELFESVQAAASVSLTGNQIATFVGNASLKIANNLNDVASPSASRTNLGLGSLALQANTSVNIDGGTIDGTTIGGAVPGVGTFSTLTGTGTSSFYGPVVIVGSGGTGGGVTLTKGVGFGTLTLPSANDTLVGRATTDTLTNKTLTSPLISGGTIDNTVIGGTTPAAGNFSTVGIGAGTPLAALSVGNGSLANSTLAVQISCAGAGSQAYYGANNNGGYGIVFGYINAYGGLTGGVLKEIDSNPLYIQVANGATSATFLNNGNVGIGTTSPAQLFSVNGIATATFGYFGTTSYVNTLNTSQQLTVAGNVAYTGIGIAVAVASGLPAVLSFAKSRGTTVGDVTTAVSSGDNIGLVQASGADGSGTVQPSSAIKLQVDSTVSTGKVPGRLVFSTANSAGALTEAMRIDSSQALNMGGANVVIDANRIFYLRSYTIATLPAASLAAGTMIFISDTGGGGSAAISDGATWRQARDGNYNANATAGGSVTLTPLTDANIQKFTATLTATLTLTYGVSNAYKGMTRRTISPASLGGFSFTASGKSLSANQWVDHVYDGSAWQEAAFGSL